MSSPTDQRMQTWCLFTLTAIAVGFALYALSPVLIPFVLAIFFVYTLTPLIDALTHYLRVPKALAVVITGVLGCLALVVIGLIIATSVSQMTTSADVYKDNVQASIKWLFERLPLEQFHLDESKLNSQLFSYAGSAVTWLLSGTMTGVVGVLSNGTMVIIFMIFMLFGRTAGQRREGGLLEQIEAPVKRYVATMAFVSTLTGVLVGVTLWLLGVQFALLFGFLTVLLNFIPNIGSLIATLLPLPVVLTSPELGWPAKIAALAIPGVLQFVIGNVLQPRMMGRSLNLHPVMVLLALIFFGMIWGIVGMFLATPITAVIRIVLERFELTRPVALLMTGRLDLIEGGAAESGEL